MPKNPCLSESDIPERWYNILPEPPGAAGSCTPPGTLQPMGPARPRSDLPAGDHRPGVLRAPGSRSPTRCARSTRSGGRARSTLRDRLEKALDTPAHIYFKIRGGFTGRVAQAERGGASGLFTNSREGIKRLTTENRAPGNGGPRSAFAGPCSTSRVTVYMVKVSYEQEDPIAGR